MPQKTHIEPSSIHRSQLYHQQPSVSSSRSEIRTLGAPQQAPAAAPADVKATPTSMRQAKIVRHQIAEHSNNVRWELTSGFTIPPGPTTTILHFDNENIGGQGARHYAGAWSFQPPPKYTGVYHVGAYIEFLTGLLAFMRTARLEIWLTNVVTNTSRMWSVIDKQYLEYGNTDDDGYLEKVVLGNSDLVMIKCGERMTIRLYTDNTATHTIGDMASLYGYVFCHWCGCQGEDTDDQTITYLLPDII